MEMFDTLDLTKKKKKKKHKLLKSFSSSKSNMAGCPGTLRKTPKLLPMIHKALNELAYTLQEKGEENGKPLQYSCLQNPMNSTKRQKDRTLKDELPRSVGAQHDTGDQWRITPEEMNKSSQSKNNTQL